MTTPDPGAAAKIVDKDGLPVLGSAGDAAYAGADPVADKPTLMSLLAALWAVLKAGIATTPQMSSGGNMIVQTAAVGANWTALGAQACKQLTFVNNTGTTIEFDQGAAGIGLPIFDGQAFSIFGIANANQIRVRRVDQSNTQVTVAARWEA